MKLEHRSKWAKVFENIVRIKGVVRMHKTIAASVVCLGLIAQNPAMADRAPRGYTLLQSNPTHSFRYSQPGEPVRRGKLSERFEIRDGFCYGTDCARDRLRSEIRFPKNRDVSKERGDETSRSYETKMNRGGQKKLESQQSRKGEIKRKVIGG